ncbi:MAG: hypothetical protein RLZZ458_2841 [Planctomycetota bacterium]
MAEVFADAGDECIGFTGFGGYGEEFCFFVDNDEFGVFEDDAEASVDVLFGSAFGGVAAVLFKADFEQIAGFEEASGLYFGGAINRDAVVVKESGGEAAGTIGEELNSAVGAGVGEGGVRKNGQLSAFDWHPGEASD